MLVYFLACVKSGRAFCPVDINTPKERVEEIVETTDSKVVLVTEEIELSREMIDVKSAKEIISSTPDTISKRKLRKKMKIYSI